MNIKLIRVDYRLIHGQVVTKWVKQKNITRIIVVNDDLANDEFMSDIYEMAAPSDVSVNIYTVEEAIRKYKEETLGNGNILIILKDVETAFNLVEQNFKIDELQIGGLGGEVKSVPILPGISITQDDVGYLEKLKIKCNRIYFNVLPSEPVLELDEALNKFNK